MSDKTTQLARIEQIVREIAPAATCELWDLDSKVKCSVLYKNVDVVFDLHGLSVNHIRGYARQLAAKLERQ